MSSLLRVIVLVAMFAGVARADVVSEEVEQCQGHAAGDACHDRSHVCVPKTCSRMNYTPHGPEGTTSFPCLMCEPGNPGTSASLIAGIAIGVVAIGAGVWLAFRRRRT